MSLAISPELSLPIDAVTETFGILAKKGAGKSNAAVVMAEEMWDAGVPWVAIDPKGDWWGVRSSTDGKGAGLGLPVFGGRHGDFPLEPTAGAVLADLILAERLTCVLDVSEFTKGEVTRFLLAFADYLYRHAEDEPLHLFLEEAHEYLPQRVGGDESKTVNAWQRIVKQGRFKGLGCTLISQRSASLNKDVLTQVDTLIVLRTLSPQDRAAVKGWLDVHADAAAALATLPTLADGEAWVWSPEFLGQLTRIHFRRRRTFDSGATPKVGQTRRPPATLADIDRTAIEARMADTIERAKADDPAELRRRLRELERELVTAQKAVPEPVVEQVPVVSEEVLRRLEEVLEPAATLYAEIRERLAEEATARTERGQMRLVLAPERRTSKTEPPASGLVPGGSCRTTPARPAPRPVATGDGELKLGKAERSVLTVLAEFPEGRTKVQLALLAGYAHGGGGFNNTLGRLRSQGLISPAGSETITLTEAGDAAVMGMAIEPLPSRGEELVEHWKSHPQIGRAAGTILGALWAVYPKTLSKDELGEATGYEPGGGGFNNALGRLRTLGLVSKGRDIGLSEEVGG